MTHAAVRFGTSGARGRVRDLTNAVCYAITAAFVQHLEATSRPVRRVALAGDRRPSSGRIVGACAHALADHGIAVVDCGHVPTPALAAYALGEEIPAIMVTGSHIPADRNGIKLYTAVGEILKDDERAIERRVVRVPPMPTGRGPESGEAWPDSAVVDRRARDRYLARFVDAFGPDALDGLAVGMYGHSAVGRELTVQVLEALGARVTPLGFSDTFVAVDTEAIREEDRALARQWSAQSRLDAIVTTDGDGDRPMLADATGEWLRGDIAGVLAAGFVGATIVVTPVSSNTAAERSSRFERVVRTRIGSPYVVEAMQRCAQERAGATIVGYEANGGLLQHTPLQTELGSLSPLPTRDALIVIVALLREVARGGSTLAELAAALPRRFTASDRIAGIDATRSGRWLEAQRRHARLGLVLAPELGVVESVDTTDGVRMTFANGEIVHVRPSGNAPELRCYCEADTQERARALVAEVLARLVAALA